MKRKSGINMSDVKISNRGMILNQIKEQPKSRKDIAEKLKLTPAAITMLVNELIDEGCIQESGMVDEPGRVGRKKVFIELNKNYRYLVGINIEGKELTVGVGNLKCEVMASTQLDIYGMNPEQVLNVAAEAVRRVIIDSKVKEDKILGVGVGIVGKVDNKAGISRHAYGIWKEEVPIASILEDKLGLPVLVENNVRALALAEMALTVHRKISNMVFVKLGPGIGSAVILEKEIYKGANNNSGEIGHMITNLDGKVCRCGLVGCLETVASVRSVLDEIHGTDAPDKFTYLKSLNEGKLKGIKERHLIQAYLEKDEEIVALVDQLICYLTIGIINSMKFYDPHKLVLYSEMFNEPILFEKLLEQLKKHNPTKELEVCIETSHLKSPKCVGGIVLGARELFFNKGGMIDA